MDKESEQLIKEDIRIRELLEEIESKVIKIVKEVNTITIDVSELKKLTPFIREE